MKTILIEEVSNGWLVRNHDPFCLNPSYKPGDIHVYRSIHELSAELPTLLEREPKPHCPCPTPNEIAQLSKTPGGCLRVD